MEDIKLIATYYNNGYYGSKYPESKFVLHEKRVVTTWWMGNNYQNSSSYYGAYPPMYLKRVENMFPYNVYKVLHLFSGSLPKGNYDRFDIKPELNPEILGDAEILSYHISQNKGHSEYIYDVILADPPYLEQDAVKYNTPMPNKKLVIEECYKVLNTHGYLIWLDCSLPMFRKDMWNVVGLIAVIRSTNHRIRLSVIFQKKE